MMDEETAELREEEVRINQAQQPDEIKDFKPVGTMVFIVLLLLFTALVFFGLYNIQVDRHV